LGRVKNKKELVLFFFSNIEELVIDVCWPSFSSINNSFLSLSKIQKKIPLLLFNVESINDF